MKRYELVFTNTEKKFPRYKRHHASLLEAREEVAQVKIKMADVYGEDVNYLAYAGNAIVYGPDCGRDGTAVAWGRKEIAS